jgi:hypothetical protein
MVRRALPVLAAAVAVLCAGGGAAARPAKPAAVPAAASPGWRITKLLPNLVAGGLWAGGPRDAWLAGDACADPATCGESATTANATVVVKHWDGTAWRSIAMPKAYVNTPQDAGVGPVAATSAKNAWVFAYRGIESIDHTDALHRTGTSWAKPVRLNGMIETAVAPSAGQMWAFGLPYTGKQHGYYAHFTGTAWKTGGFPVQGTAAAALADDDVWVGGQSASGALVIEHWNGHSWAAKTIVPAGSTSLVFAWITGIAAVGPHQVWASVTIGSGKNPTSFLERWNGTSWKRISLPWSGPDIGSPVASDGHGGVWVGLDIGTGAKPTTWFGHYANGKWTKTAVPDKVSPPPNSPTMIDQLTWIPGTRSLWATGEVDSLDVAAAVFKYGP